MKKIYTFIFASAFALLSMNTNATTINVTVGPGGTNAFNPNTFAAVVGDVVVWTLQSGTHTVNSISTPLSSVPAGAAAISSGTMSTIGSTYSYTITVVGTYGYQCNFHGNLAGGTGMIGGFTVSSTGIIDPATNLLTSAYPNPFSDKVTLKYTGIQSVEVFNVVGEKVKSMELSATEAKVDLDFTGFPAGIYFYRTYKEGTIVETRKIVKAN